MGNDPRGPRKVVSRFVALLALLGLYLAASLGLAGLSVMTATPAAAQQRTRRGQGGGQGSPQGNPQFQGGGVPTAVQGQPQPRRRNNAAEIIGTAAAVGAVLFAPRPQYVDDPYYRHRRRRRRWRRGDW
jgi:hypothetical protein